MKDRGGREKEKEKQMCRVWKSEYAHGSYRQIRKLSAKVCEKCAIRRAVYPCSSFLAEGLAGGVRLVSEIWVSLC